MSLKSIVMQRRRMHELPRPGQLQSAHAARGLAHSRAASTAHASLGNVARGLQKDVAVRGGAGGAGRVSRKVALGGDAAQRSAAQRSAAQRSNSAAGCKHM